MVNVAAGVVAVMGRPVVLTTGGVDYALSGVLRAPYVGYTIAGVPIDRPDPSMLFQGSDLEALTVKTGDTILASGVTYTIIAIETRADGVNVTLRG